MGPFMGAWLPAWGSQSCQQGQPLSPGPLGTDPRGLARGAIGYLGLVLIPTAAWEVLLAALGIPPWAWGIHSFGCQKHLMPHGQAPAQPEQGSELLRCCS